VYRPITRPTGVSLVTVRAAEAFAWAVDEATRRYRSYDVLWGDIHRVRIGAVDVPFGGCVARSAISASSTSRMMRTASAR
jgi:steroid 5-alpha reductase family enzyme